MHGGWQADFLEQRGERVAFGDDDFAVVGSLLFGDSRSRRGLSGFRVSSALFSIWAKGEAAGSFVA
jgi:hypothetical protein